jgi:hypothetical protein
VAFIKTICISDRETPTMGLMGLNWLQMTNYELILSKRPAILLPNNSESPSLLNRAEKPATLPPQGIESF